MQLWLIPILPLLGFLLNGIFGKRLAKPVINTIAVGSVVLSFLWVVKTLNGLGAFSGGLEETYKEHYYTWIQSGALNIGVDFAIDRLTAVMLMVVTGVGALIHIYAVGYMAHEGGYYRFFAYLNLFMFFMLILVLGANFLLLFVGWEGVGLCSYLLIGFYFLEKFATDAGNKAFIVNRIGDFGFALAIFLVGNHFGTLDFVSVMTQVKGMPVETVAGLFTAISLLLLVGATGKSAQIPLYVWLPDAMAGPTPVSALIHAATMVTAGVYMIARTSQIYLHSLWALEIVAIVGLTTAFVAATIGLAQNDIKKVFAYSTVSQLGYMFLGLGVGAFSAGIFHLMTHAFFKALLFLGAGSVIHACSGEQDMRRMGGLRKYTPITMVTLLCASLAIAGFPFLSGAASKDMILEAAYEHAPWMYWVGVFTAGMTAFYVFRAFFMTFFGEYKGKPAAAGHGHGHDDHADHGHDDHSHETHGGTPHESPAVMWIPLAILAVLSVVGGFINIPHFLEPVFPLQEGEPARWLEYVVIADGLLGIALAYLFYVAYPGLPESLVNSFKGLHRLIYNKYFVDEFYDATVVEPVVDGSRQLLWRMTDVRLIDGIANGIGTTARGLGSILRRGQSGYIRSYAAWVIAGTVLAIAYIGFWGSIAMTLLDVVLFLPLAGFLLLLILPKESSRMAAMVISLAVFIVSLGLLIPYWFQYPSGHTFSTDVQWISYPPIRYHVALDGLSLWLVLLSTLLTPIAALVSWKYIDKRVKEYYAFLLLLEFGVIGVFVAMDLFLFYVFWEVSLVPMYFLIGIWGHERRIYAAVKFFLFTMAGSVLMLGAIIFLYNRTGTFDYGQIQGMIQTGSLVFDQRTELLLFLAFFIAFAIKVPLFPLHTWLPDAHVEAPTAGSLMLASVMLKMGTYGLLRFCVPLFPEAAHRSAPWIAALAIIGIIYGALVALVQPNMKKLVAYSSVSHLGFVVLGIFSFTQQGLDGAVYQMLNHGISTGALFILVGYLYERRHSLEISAYGGVATPAPNLAIVFLITTLASIGMPTLNNFVGEYLVLQGTASANFGWAVFAALGVIFSACYMLWLYQRTFFGKASESLSHHMPDLTTREWAAIVPLVILMVWMGSFAQSFLPSISVQNAAILEQTKQLRVERVAVPAQRTAEVSRANR